VTARHPPLLQPLDFPLRGKALIEASAGTGKTFTIAALYLRLVLDHGNAFGRPLTPPEILVVTFTEAATQELRDRIRARLAEAALAFRVDPAQVRARPPGEDLLHDLRASYPPERWSACACLLQAAAEWMDEAAVSTIHGWCNRMLREHAFDSGALFEQTLVTDQAELLDEAVRDYWRTFFYPLGEEDARTIRGWWPALATFSKQVCELLPHAQRLPEAALPQEALAQAREESGRELAQLKAPWAAWVDELEALLLDACERGQIDVKRCNRGHIRGWMTQLRDWATGAHAMPMEAGSKGWLRLTRAGLAEVWTKGKPFAHPALDAMETLKATLAALPDGREAILAHAARWVAQRAGQELHRQAQMGFDDLLTQLHAALHRPGSGERLAQLIRTQFPVALIDEFQDTDPIQYGIFRRIYADAPDTALVLIGDPKQAIYAFRGADIYTYLQARVDTEGGHYTLGTNFRSTQAMVGAVNCLFGQAEARPGAGAFRFATREGNPVPFLQVQARGSKEHWWVDGSAAPALTCWWVQDDQGALDDRSYRQAMASACAAEIVRLLQLAQDQRAGFRQEDGSFRALQPHDIAVLVNGRSEAEAVREALEAGGVRSVYLSDRDSVFDSPAAGELQRLLQACAAPEDGALVRAALATPLLALDWAALDALNQDELQWEQSVEQFRAYLQQWRRQGVLPMLRQLLHDFEVPRRLLAAGDERQLTDLLHLAELLQQASTLLQGEHALVRFLAEQREGGPANGDHRQVRLESDADLLKVVTVHKSKGLEYPLVFLPFPCACRPVTAKSVPLKVHDAQGHAHIVLKPDEAQVEQADGERLGEDLRKLYVALTRAVHATWIGVAPTSDFERTAIGWLLGPEQAPTRERLQEMLAPAGAVVVEAPVPNGERYRANERDIALDGEPRIAHAQRERWWIASYSRLLVALDAHVPQRAAESAEEENYEEEAAEDAGPVAPASQPVDTGTLHAFPRGAAAGTFLHGLLEWAGKQGFAQVAQVPQELELAIARGCLTPQWKEQQAVLREWLTHWLATPLDLSRLAPGGAPVAPTQMHSYQVELEFWFSAAAVDVPTLDRLVTAHTLGGAARPAVHASQLNGMLKGFMDLVFEHEGRYYVADYKSNRLGPGDADYTLKAMRDEVLAKRYELQYSLYLFALHRLLRARLPDYDYDRHVGGAVYIFLRGHAASTQGLHMERPPRALMDALDALFQGEALELQP
jgi:exodeoxyribonuclease V beta subunit